MPVPSGAATTGKFDTSQFNATGNKERPEQDPNEILAYKRGMDWLVREIPMIEAFISAWTKKNIKVRIGPVPCTDGDTVFLRPLPLYDGQDEPDALYHAHMWHELAHVVLSQVYEPADSRKIEHALKIIGDKEYGKPAGHMWNALEDGRVEDRLYKTAPGARKHIVKEITTMTPEIVESCYRIGAEFEMEHLLLTSEPVQLAIMQAEGNAIVADNTLSQDERKQRLVDLSQRIMQHSVDTGDRARAKEIGQNIAADIALLMATYLETAGYHAQAREFEPRVIAALDDSEIASAIVSAQRFEKSLPVLKESTRRVLARARQLGFYADWDERALDPQTGEPQVIDWNSLSDDEKQAVRDQLKNQHGMPRVPGQNEAVVVNLPKELIEELMKQMQNQQGQPQPGQQGQPQPGQQGQEQSGEGQTDSGADGDQRSDNGDGSGDPASADDARRYVDALEGNSPSGDGKGNQAGQPVPSPQSGDGAGGDGAPAGDDGDGGSEADASGAQAGEGRSGDLGGDAEAADAVAGSSSGGGFGTNDEQDYNGQSGRGTTADESNGLDQFARAQGKPEYARPDEVLKDAYAERNAERASTEASSEDGDASVDPTSAGEPSEDGDTSPWDEQDLEAAAMKQHEANEAARQRRISKFEERFGEIEDTIRPPHVEYVTKDEAKFLEAKDETAQTIKEAMNMEVGEISGSPENRFLFKQRKMQITKVEASAAPSLDKYNDVLAGEANRLRAIFKQNEKAGFTGQFEIGSHLKGSALPGFIMGEHLKPFDRRYQPKKLSYAVTLLIDQSGSMMGSKIDMARTGLAMQATLLDKLGIPFEVLGFSTRADNGGWQANLNRWDYRYLVQHDVFKGFDEGWTPEQRAKVMSISTNDSNLDGLALSWAWDRLSRRKEHVKILMTYSDGQPNPDTDNQIKIMKHVLKKMMLSGAVAIGVGIQSHAPEQLYPKSVYCDDVRTLPRLVTKTLEEELSRKRR